MAEMAPAESDNVSDTKVFWDENTTPMVEVYDSMCCAVMYTSCSDRINFWKGRGWVANSMMRALQKGGWFKGMDDTWLKLQKSEATPGSVPKLMINPGSLGAAGKKAQRDAFVAFATLNDKENKKMRRCAFQAMTDFISVKLRETQKKLEKAATVEGMVGKLRLISR